MSAESRLVLSDTSVSPVISQQVKPSLSPKVCRQCLTFSCTNALIGAKYTILDAAGFNLKAPEVSMYCDMTLRMASSSTPVLPEPVGAATTCRQLLLIGPQSPAVSHWTMKQTWHTMLVSEPYAVRKHSDCTVLKYLAAAHRINEHNLIVT